jgi:hypothetical protein
MLATLVPEPFNAKGWVVEADGYRILAYKEGSRVTEADDDLGNVVDPGTMTCNVTV